MASKEKFKFNEERLKPGQREAARLLVENEFAGKGERKTKNQISQEAGTSRRNLVKWEYGDHNFIEYKNYLASAFVDSYLPRVYKKLMDGIEQGSMRGIEMFLKRIGDMDTKSDVTIHQGNGDDRTKEERIKELKERIEGDKDEGANGNDGQ